MAWTIRFSKKADKALGKIDKQVAKKIISELETISQLDDPRVKGKALTGNLRGLWRYRVGDYRIICNIEDSILVVLVIDIAHRSKIYRQ